MTIRLGIMASGGGTSFEALTTRIRDGRLEGFEPAVVICNVPHGQAGAYDRARRLEVPAVHAFDPVGQFGELQRHGADMVLGMGYIRKVDDAILDHYGNKAWNIHPALLPNHGGKGMHGLTVHESVLAAGDRETGATVHIMTPEYDAGPILQQVRVPVFNGETPEQLQQRVLPFEYALMATTLALYRDGLLENCPRED